MYFTAKFYRASPGGSAASARRTSSATLRTPSFAMMRVLWTSTVRTPMPSAAARPAVECAWRGLEASARWLHGPESLFARTWHSGSMALGMMVFLLALLVSYYLL
jgi:hypothetical protein